MIKFKVCHWSVKDELGDYMCVCDASEHCGDWVGGDESPCDGCIYYIKEEDETDTDI